MKKLLILLFLMFSLKAEDLSISIEKLGDEDFNVREEATEKLSKLPFSRIENILDLAKHQTDPEISYRLKLIAKNIFYNNEFNTNENIKKLTATLDIEYNFWGVSPCKDDLVKLSASWFRGVLLKYVDADGVCKGKLKCWDIILLIDNYQYEQHPDYCQHGLFQVGKEYELTVLRFKETEIEKIENRSYPDLTQDAYKILTVKVTPIIQPDIRLIDMDTVTRILDGAWREYLNDYLNKP